MLILAIDTSHKYLSLALIRDNELIDSVHELCFKKQSEKIFVEMKKMFDRQKLSPNTIDAVCIAVGPGSYTGIRIGMTIAKVLCSMKEIPLYTISTLCLYANNNPKSLVILDARSKRAYLGKYDYSIALVADTVLEIDKIVFDDFNLIGDLSLIDKEDFYYNTPQAFLNTIESWNLVENVDLLTPTYLKETKEYEV